mgnify:CR=1 FL=1
MPISLAAPQSQLEEKDEQVKVLQSQIEALKISLSESKPAAAAPASDAQSLKDEIERKDALLSKCKDSIL